MISVKNKIQNKREQLSSQNMFRNEAGAIDLASIMVGIIVIGLIGGVIAATVFTVIPWSQDNAAKQQLDSIVAAESAYIGLSSATPSSLPSGYKANSFGNSSELSAANLLQSGSSYCASTPTDGKSYTGYSQSASGKVWSVTDQNTKPTIFTGTLPTDCQFILTSAGSTASSPDLTWSKQTTSTPGPIIGTSGDFTMQLSASGTAAYVSSNSGALWSSIPTGSNANSGASSENGNNLLVGKSLSTGFAGPVHLSTNRGTSWSQLTALSNTYIANSWVSNDGNKIIIAGGGGGGNVSIRISNDSGATFTPVKYISSSYSWVGLAVSSDGSHIYALDNAGTLYISSDSGTTWSSKTTTGTSGISTNSTGQRVLMSNGYNGKVLISNDYGVSFTSVAVGTSTTQRRTISQQAVSSDGQTMTVSGVEGANTVVFISRDAGQTWTAQSTLPNAAWSSEVSSDGTQFLISSGTTVYKG